MLDVLQDDRKRAQFVGVLQDMLLGAPGAQPVPAGGLLAANSVGANLLVRGERWAAQTAGQIRGTGLALGGLPQLGLGLAAMAETPQTEDALASASWKLVLVLALAWGLEWLARRLLRAFRSILAARAPVDDITADLSDAPITEPAPSSGRLSLAWRLLRRLPYALATLVLDLLPVAVFAGAGNALLALPLGTTVNDRLVVLAMLSAYVACRVVMCVTRAIVSPGSASMRLVRCSDGTAAYVERWMRRLSVVAVTGRAVSQWGCCSACRRPRTTRSSRWSCWSCT